MSDDDQQLVDEISSSTETSNEMVEMDEWVVDIEGRLKDSDISHAPRPSMDSNSSDSDSEEEPSIFGKWECWNDFGASFIPERKKWQLVACMMQWFGLNLKSYLEYMLGKVDLAWSYYHGVSEQFRTAENNKCFIEHLLVNSCFLIFAMVFLSREEEYRNVIVEHIYQNSFPKGLTAKDIENIVKFILEDAMRTQFYMLTMKYQIPWFVVEVVYTELSNLDRLLDIPIHKLALSCFNNLYLNEHPSKMDGDTIPEGGFQHLLHLFYWSRVPHGNYLLDTSTRKSVGDFYIPSATNLQLSQIVFENNEGGIDVSYSDKRRLHRVMQLTPLHLSENITKLYKDLLIFEQKYGGFCGLSFTSYVTCMACLLKTVSDVRVLRAYGVIPTTRFDDSDVWRCLHELKAFIPSNLKIPNELIILEEKVMAHHQRSVYRVYGEFKSRYKDLITISAIGGSLLFLFTLIQTVVSIISLKKH